MPEPSIDEKTIVLAVWIVLPVDQIPGSSGREVVTGIKIVSCKGEVYSIIDFKNEFSCQIYSLIANIWSCLEQFHITGLKPFNKGNGAAINGCQRVIGDSLDSFFCSPVAAKGLWAGVFSVAVLDRSPETDDPVSYTHLDVYKRQATGRVGDFTIVVSA